MMLLLVPLGWHCSLKMPILIRLKKCDIYIPSLSFFSDQNGLPRSYKSRFSIVWSPCSCNFLILLSMIGATSALLQGAVFFLCVWFCAWFCNDFMIPVRLLRVPCAGAQTKEELTNQLKGYSEMFGQEVSWVLMDVWMLHLFLIFLLAVCIF